MDKTLLDFEIKFYEGIILNRPDYVDAMIPLAEAYTRKGWYQKGLELDKRLAVLCDDDPTIFYNLACSYALLGKSQLALTTLKKAIKKGYKDFRHMKKDKDLQLLHSLAAFKKLLPASKS